MAGDTVIVIIGNLTADVELRFTPSGAAVANFTVASTPRTFDRQTNEWKDGETLFMRCSVWREQAENVSESLSRGMRVIVSGRLKQRSYDTKEGEKRTIVEMDVDEIGPSLRSASATVHKTQRGNAATFNPERASQGESGWGQQGGGNWDGMNDPWTTGQPRQGNVVDPSQGPQWPAPPAERGGPPPWSGTVPPGQVRPGTWTPDEPPFFAPPTVIS